MLLRPKIPDCDDVFKRYFARWYSAADWEERGFPPISKAECQRKFKPHYSASELCRLESDQLDAASRNVATIRAALRQDWPRYLAVQEPFSISWIAEFDDHWTRRRVADVLARSDPTDFANEVLVLSCELGVAIGDALTIAVPDLEWLYDRPYWESALLDPASGLVINVFDWGHQRFSEYGVDDGYVAKIGKCIQLVRADRKVSSPDDDG
jgi:hypothetical protein